MSLKKECWLFALYGKSSSNTDIYCCLRQEEAGGEPRVCGVLLKESSFPSGDWEPVLWDLERQLADTFSGLLRFFGSPFVGRGGVRSPVRDRLGRCRFGLSAGLCEAWSATPVPPPPGAFPLPSLGSLHLSGVCSFLWVYNTLLKMMLMGWEEVTCVASHSP